LIFLGSFCQILHLGVGVQRGLGAAARHRVAPGRGPSLRVQRPTRDTQRDKARPSRALILP